MSIYQNILFAIDLNTSTPDIIAKAQKLAKTLKAKSFSVVHCVEPIVGYAATFSFSAIQDEFLNDAKTELLKRTSANNIDDKDVYVVVGSPKEGILKVADELETDLIVIGSHDKSWLAPLLGSTTTFVLSNAKCDVLTINLR